MRWSNPSPASRSCRTPCEGGSGRPGLRGLRGGNDRLAPAARRHGRGRRARHPPARRLRGGDSPPQRRVRAGRSPGRDRHRPPERRADRRAAGLLQRLAADRPPREPPTSAAARFRAARVRRRPASTSVRSPAGDVDTIVATFEPDGYAREPAGGRYVHRGPDGLRAFYEHLFSNGGGIPLEHCAAIDDGRSCALEYNVVRWGKTELPRRPGSPFTFGVRAAGSLRPASTTTRTRRSARRRSPSTPRRSGSLRRACSNHGRARGPPRPRPRAARGR